MAHIMDLPEEVILIIFDHVLKIESQYFLHHTIGKVCISWGIFCQNQRFWKTLDGTLSANELYKYRQNNCLLKTENLVYSPIRTLKMTKRLDTIFAGMPSLQSIDFSNVVVLDRSVLTCLHNNCKNLSRLKFSHDSPRNYYISPDFFGEFLKLQGPKLTWLDLTFSKLIQAEALLRGVFKCCCNLEFLSLLSIDSDRFSFPMKELQNSCKGIKYLLLSYPAMINLDDPELRKMLRSIGFPSLVAFGYTCIQISYNSYYNSYFTDRHLNIILSKSSLLKGLDIRGQRALSYYGILRLPTNHLEALYISQTRIDLDNLGDILEKWKSNLLVLDISCLKSFRINHFLRFFTAGQQMCRLLHLILNCTEVDSLTVIHLIDNCCKLRALDLTNCKQIYEGYQQKFQYRSELLQLREYLFYQLMVAKT